MTSPSSARPVEPDPLIGQRLGSFGLERVLGRGAMGTVYAGVHALIGSRVAIKVMHAAAAKDPSLAARFCAEGKAVNQVRHENVVSIFDFALAPDGRPYMVMELLEGQPLSGLLTQPVEAQILVPLLVQACNGLHAAHQMGVVHRDLKPDNLFLVRRAGRQVPLVKVLDFGVAKLRSPTLAPDETAAGMMLGTPSYMAPEQWGSPEVDARCDVYALGVTAWRALVGRLPYTGKTTADLLMAHRDGGAPAPHEVNAAVPECLSEVVMKAMAPTPDARFASAQAFAQALEEVASELGFATAEAAPSLAVVETPVIRSLGAKSQEVARHRFSELTRGGAFLHSAAPPPELFTRLLLELPCPQRALRVQAEVVRHVTREQAAAWKMEPGFAVQFVAVPDGTKEALRAWLGGGTSSAARAQAQSQPQAQAQSRPSASTEPGSSPKPPEPEPTVKLPTWNRSADHYQVLKLPHDATFEAIRDAASRLVRGFAVSSSAMSPQRAREAQAVMARTREAAQALLEPVRRAAYDAELGNFAGVARCLEAGLSLEALSGLRREFLASRPGMAERSRKVAEDAELVESRGDLGVARQLYERALQHDPLNAGLHLRLRAMVTKVQVQAQASA